MWVDIGRNEMAHISLKPVELVFEEGPLPRTIVMKWPRDLQTEDVELLGLDLQTLGLDEFRRMGLAHGEASLLSLDRPLDSGPGLVEAWRVLTGEARPPEPPDFPSS
jgi:hypothetical protein